MGAIILTGLTILVGPGTVYGNPEYTAAPNPPRIEREAEAQDQHPAILRAVNPSTEWVYHKTADNQHPDGNEQQLIWLMNRARSNPTAEGIWLANIYDRYITYAPNCSGAGGDEDLCYIAGALDYWNVDRSRLQTEFSGYDAKPPAAFDVRLYRAAKAHCEYLIGIDGQNHTGQFSRIDAEGFAYIQARGNVYSYSRSAIYGHAGFNVDWGNDGGDNSGMQPSRGHRLAIMAIDGDYTNVGLAAVPESAPAKSVGPLVITGNYCKAYTSASDHHNRFLVGTVWNDDDGDELYDPGEGIGDIAVIPDQGIYYAKTADAGGYALPITNAGTYQITFSGADLSQDVVANVVMGDDSVLLDLIDGSSSASSVDDIDDQKNGSQGSGGGGGGACFIAVMRPAMPANRLFAVTAPIPAIFSIGWAASTRRKQKK